MDNPQGNDALRYDEDKLRYDLIPADSLHELAKVYTYGAKKYEPRNWEKGMNWGRCFGSLMRHAWAWWRGEEHDPESGCHHMAHVAWNAMALVSYEMRSIGVDDRPLSQKRQPVPGVYGPPPPWIPGGGVGGFGSKQSSTKVYRSLADPFDLSDLGGSSPSPNSGSL